MFSFGWLQPQRPLLDWVLKLAVASSILAVGAVQSREVVSPPGTVAAAELPAEAQAVLGSIVAGRPLPGPKDGAVFGNRERLLPARQRGFYREYTVPTPGARNRGARRIVCGAEPPRAPEACFYTADHYASFRRIAR